MINFLNKNNKLEEGRNSINVSYTRNINIIFGHYPYPDIVNNMLIEIKNNLDSELKNFTNVKGGMTAWNYFIGKNTFNHFMTYLINKYQTTHPDTFKHFMERMEIKNAWGNEIKKGDSVAYHDHQCVHGILYLTKGTDLILPELNLKITPEPGDYYIFPPTIIHGVEPSKINQNRYSLIFNIISNDKGFNYNKKVKGE